METAFTWLLAANLAMMAAYAVVAARFVLAKRRPPPAVERYTGRKFRPLSASDFVRDYAAKQWSVFWVRDAEGNWRSAPVQPQNIEALAADPETVVWLPERMMEGGAA